MPTKERLRQLVDELPDTELDAAQRYLEYLRDTSDPLLRKLLNSPDDEEELTEEDLAAAAEAEDQPDAEQAQVPSNEP